MRSRYKLFIVNIVFLLAFGAVGETLAQSQQKVIYLHYPDAKAGLNPNYGSNRKAIAELLTLLRSIEEDSVVSLTKVRVDSYASLEGGMTKNKALSIKRSNTILKYLRNTGLVMDNKVINVENGDFWDKLYGKVQQSNMPYKEEFCNIIENTPEEVWGKQNPYDQNETLLDSRNKQLMLLKQGIPYRYMMDHISEEMRVSEITILYEGEELEGAETDMGLLALWGDNVSEEAIWEYQQKQEAKNNEILSKAKEDAKNAQEKAAKAEAALAESRAATEELAKMLAKVDSIATTVTTPTKRKTIFALKSNLLYTLAATPNLEVEVPIGKRWSVGAQWMLMWWLERETNTSAWQIQAGDIEARYWFGNREEQEVLTGWFLGAFGSGGFYDFQPKDTKGTQGEFTIAGLSGGYSMPFKNDRFFMEFVLGLGYLWSDYRHYEVVNGDALYSDGPQDKYFRSFVPAKAEITLGWRIK